MKIHILYPFKDGPWGGANQFLKAIREYFISINKYTENIESADIILFNSSPLALNELSNILFEIKKEFPKKVFINRIDGPVFYIRNRGLFVDKAFYEFNDLMCEGTIFQSNWSKKKNYYLGMKNNIFEATILNAPNPSIFNKDRKKRFNSKSKIRLIATSWSSNIKKGFDTYKWIDENIDFNKYDMTFVGNSPYDFKNIVIKSPMNSIELANELKEHDIYITASQSDPCSNSLIEAMHCGLPVLGLDDGGHTEIISNAGEVFTDNYEIIDKLEKISSSYQKYQSNINLPSLQSIGNLYFEFLRKVHEERKDFAKQKRYLLLGFMKFKVYMTLGIIEEKIYSIKKRFK